MMRVLFITYHFPPDAAIGGVRPYQFARLLPDHGIQPWILTVEPQFAEKRDDAFLPEGIPPERILRTGLNGHWPARIARLPASLTGGLRRRATAPVTQASPPPSRSTGGPRSDGWKAQLLSWLTFPDPRMGWQQPALQAANNAIQQIGFDAIVSTSPPRVAHLIARRLARQHHLPWIMDLRDPWYGEWEAEATNSKLRTRLHQRLFEGCAEQASAIVLNTEAFRDHLIERYPRLRPRLFCVPNGLFDNAHSGRENSRTVGQFGIGYYGWRYARRSAEPFLRGMRLWLDRTSLQSSQVAARFVGDSEDAEAVRVAGEMELCSTVRFEGAVPRGVALGMMQQEYVLLLIANNQPYQIPAKVYDYLAMNRRILAITERGSATGRLLSGRPGCVVAETPEEIAVALEGYCHEWTRGMAAHVDRSEWLAGCSYAHRAEEMANVIRGSGQTSRRRDRYVVASRNVAVKE